MASSHSAGTLVGAVLESAGYHYQSAILDALGDPFKNEVGGLIYLVGIIIAITFVATQGGYKFGAWLLIGPPIFFSVIQVRDNIPNARWEFAKDPRPYAPVVDGVGRIVPGSGEANVSTLFRRYVELISVVNQEMLAKISDGRKKSDIWFIMKGELFAMMHTARIQDVGFARLLHQALYGECGDVIRWGRMVNDPLFRDAEADRDAQNLAGSAEAQEARDWFLPSQQYALKKYNDAINTTSINLKDKAAEYVAAVENRDLIEVTRTKVSCRDIWGYAVAGILRHSKRELTKLETRAQNWGIPQAVIDNVLLQAHGVPSGTPLVFNDGPDAAVTPGQSQRIARIIAQYYLRNEQADPDQGTWMAHMSNRHEHRVIKERMMGHNAMSESSRIAVREYQEKERLIHAASSLPYYQGLVLFFLGTFFPFFALLLLVPGKQGGFVTWFTLWLWVKSWDIGLAVVMLLDDTFFALFSVERQGVGKIQEITPAAEAELGVAMASLREMDPTFQLGTYYTLISVCVLAVPPTMAQLILGSLRSGTSLVAKGADSFSGIFASAAGAHSTRQAMMALRQDHAAAVEERAKGYAKALRQGRALPRTGPLPQGGVAPSAGPSAPAAGAAAGAVGAASAAAIAAGTPPGPTQGSKGGQGMPADGGGMSQTVATSRPALDKNAGRLQAARQLGRQAGMLQAMNRSSPTALSKLSTDPFTRAMSSALGREEKQVMYEMNARLNEAEQAYISQLAVWHESISDRTSEIYQRMAIYGAIPIPWSAMVDEQSGAEVAMALQEFEKDQKMQMAVWQQNQDIAAMFLGATNDLLGRVGKNRVANMSQLQGMYQQNPALREQVLKSVTERIREQSTKSAARVAIGGGVAAATDLPGAVQRFFGVMDTAQQQWEEDPNHGKDFYPEDLSPEPPEIIKRLQFARPKHEGAGQPSGRSPGRQPVKPPEAAK